MPHIKIGRNICVRYSDLLQLNSSSSFSFPHELHRFIFNSCKEHYRVTIYYALNILKSMHPGFFLILGAYG